MKHLFALSAILIGLVLTAVPATAQDKPAFRPSTCAAIAQGLPNVTYAAYTPVSLSAYQVEITFVGHSTYVIESAGGVIIATDYAGFAGQATPKVVTMNRAHSTHYTDFPDPAIAHVLRGWNPAGGPAKHHLHVKDLMVRNVSTDIRGWSSTVEPDGNSIFIYEDRKSVV